MDEKNKGQGQVKAQYRILVVDDEPEIRSMLTEFLKSENYISESAADGSEVIQMLDDFDPDCILMDVRMPHLNGIDALKMVKFRKPHLEVIMVSAVSNIKVAETAVENGAFGFVTKPVTLEDLEVQISAALEKRSKNLQSISVSKNTINDSLSRQAKTFKLDHLKNEQVIETLKIPFKLLSFASQEFTEHAMNVSWLSYHIAMEMKLSTARLCELAGLYHDVGKLSLSKHLWKDYEVKWNPAEKKLFQQFPIYSQEFVQSFSMLGCLGPAIRSHMEHMDGAGFPDQITGDVIPVESKILAVANALDEIYQKNGLNQISIDLLQGRALADEVLKGSKGRFDPAVVQALEVFFDKWKYVDPEEHAILIEYLKPNTILSKDIVTRKGHVIFGRYTILTDRRIAKIQEINEIDPIDNDIFVLEPEVFKKMNSIHSNHF